MARPLSSVFSGVARVWTRRQRRMLRRAALGVVSPGFREAVQPMHELVAELLNGLPPTTFRCGACGRRVYSYQPAADGRSFTASHRGRGLVHLECPEHGTLADFTVADWRAEWTRRGNPAHLNWRIRPLS